jgi:hypothetical protein
VREVLAFTGTMAFDFLVDKRKIKSIANILHHSSNESLVMFARYSIMCQKWNKLCKTYAISYEDSCHDIDTHVYNCFLQTFEV